MVGIPPLRYLPVLDLVVAELRHGCLCSAKPAANRSALDALLAPYICLPFDDSAADQYAAIRRHLESLGQIIGPLDLQIAAIARANRCRLVTHNTTEFGRVPGLAEQVWMSAGVSAWNRVARVEVGWRSTLIQTFVSSK